MLDDEDSTTIEKKANSKEAEYVLSKNTIDPKQLKIYKGLLLAVAYTAGIGGIVYIYIYIVLFIFNSLALIHFRPPKKYT